MAATRVCVLRAPGTNCDIETAHAFAMCGAVAERVHLFRLLENPRHLRRFQILCIPGGFSYGDDIGAGVIFSRHLRGRLHEAIAAFLNADKLVLGICNGFQVLLKAGLFFDSPAQTAGTEAHDEATLTWNTNGKYTALWVTLHTTSVNNVFLRRISRIELPVAHAEGRLVVRDHSVLTSWRQSGRIAMRYSRPEGPDDNESDTVLPYPFNPNGSVANIAGLSDVSGRILGLMPHPERFIHATQHPQWTRRMLRGNGDGLTLFQNGVEYFS